ncbi:MAG: glutamine--fructose-6-phosphate transaminase (isomerizing) [Candidatus Odinarchaeia archaeon]
MCGIVGVIIKEDKVADILTKSLRRLEYRGYDSVGVATIENNRVYIKKDKGKIDEVNEKVDLLDMPGKIGIGHTRWATHGPPSKINSHPHTDCENKIVVVHNGIIENFSSLKEELTKNGHVFKSQTDTEVIPHLIEEKIKSGLGKLNAIIETLKQLKGSYALAILFSDDPESIYVARNDSPLVIGIKGNEAVFCASDIPAFLPITNQVIFLYDNEIAKLSLGKAEIFTIKGKQITREVFEVKWNPEMAKKGGFPHFMLKEIHEQPRALRNTLRIDVKNLDKIAEIITNTDKLFITAAGTSFNASSAGKYMFSRLCNIQAETVISSEFDEVLHGLDFQNSTIIAVTQSGETSDTINASRYAQERGAKIIAITNTVGSSITRFADATIVTQAGPEIGVAATKTFLVQLGSIALLNLRLALMKGSLKNSEYETYIKELNTIPDIIKKVIHTQEDKIKKTVTRYADSQSFFFLGRGMNAPVALEGALKLKEISYIHAEGYPAGESKHGPIALIEEGFPVVFICPNDTTRDRIIGNIMEMKARGARIISVINVKDDEIKELSDTYYEIPNIPIDIFNPIAYIVPLQLFAYYMTVQKGYDPDKPRNLAKAVTVM